MKQARMGKSSALALGGFLFLALAAGAARAETLDFDLSSRAAHGSFAGPLSNIFPRLSGLYELGGLGGQVDSTNYHEVHAGFLVTGDAGAEKANVTAGLGARIALVGNEKDTGGALALGGIFEARLPAFNRIGTRLSLYAAPKASSFGDLTSYLEYMIDGDYQVLRNASIYGGYRGLRIGADTKGWETVDTGLHLGLRLTF